MQSQFSPKNVLANNSIKLEIQYYKTKWNLIKFVFLIQCQSIITNTDVKIQFCLKLNDVSVNFYRS